MILKCVKKLPQSVVRFLLERVLLGLLVWVLAVVMVVCASVVAVIAMIVAILDPLKAADIIKNFGETLAE
ncbi:hypothetical protein Ahp2_07 [Aeromonas phage Ahp2]|nr:hypothetical protein Ahp2_07 [Aeromonas phage Ahp2]